jgi:hypothetical protein
MAGEIGAHRTLVHRKRNGHVDLGALRHQSENLEPACFGAR